MIRSLLRGVGGLGMFGGGYLLRQYAQNSNTSDSAKFAATVGGYLLQAKGIHSMARGFTGSMATGMRDLKWGRAANAFEGVDKFLSIGSTGNLLRGGLSLTSHVANFPVNAVTGGAEYARLAGRTLLDRGSFSTKWNNFFTRASHIKSPFAPAIALGLGIGGFKALAYNSSTTNQTSFWGSLSPSNNYVYDPLKAPIAPGYMSNAAVGPINYENFGGGVQIGRSAITSRTVMDGQRAVTTKMLKARRV